MQALAGSDTPNPACVDVHAAQIILPQGHEALTLSCEAWGHVKPCPASTNCPMLAVAMIKVLFLQQ